MFLKLIETRLITYEIHVRIHPVRTVGKRMYELEWRLQSKW